MDEQVLKLCRGNVEAYEKVMAVRAKYADKPFWESADARVMALGQLREHVLVMDFHEFHGVVEKAIGRPVWTHEFADPDSLIAEIEGIEPPADFKDVLDKLPKDKPAIVFNVDA